MNRTKKNHSLIAGFLLGIFVSIFVGALFLIGGQAAYAQSATAEARIGLEGAAGGIPGDLPNAPEHASNALGIAEESIIQPNIQVALLTALLNLATYVTDRLAYEAAVAIASGGEGQSSLIWNKNASENWKEFGLDVAGYAIDNLTNLVDEELDIEFDLCAPANPLINYGVQLSIMQEYQPTEPRCDFRDIQNNWSSFIASAQARIGDSVDGSETVGEYILKSFSDGLRPGRNELSAAIQINFEVHEKVLGERTRNFLEQTGSDGFQPVRDVVTGQVKTPASVLQANVEKDILDAKANNREANLNAVIQNSHLITSLLSHVAGTFTNTLLSTLLNRVYTGLFDVSPEDFDPFNTEYASVGGTEAAQERFASVISPNPISITDYSALSEFVVCPSGGVTNRNINNCVMDANLAAAITRSESSEPLTIQEAIDEGLLNGSWPLISPEDLSRNQDPYCYTYGYCYGNIVKLRKARILPVGWEIAAERNSTSNPATLQEIIDGFDDCTDEGGIDSGSHKWCHLVDPNWVLKYPETQCRATVNGEILISTLTDGRASYCTDTPSCIDTDDDGNCTGGYGYCVREKNVWRFRGDECNEEYATCLSFQNTNTGSNEAFLVNTVDYGVCGADNAGCRWYRTNKYYDDAGTADDTSDDSYEWLATNDTFETADREGYEQYAGTTRADYPVSYTSDSGEVFSYSSYAYEDRLYLTHGASECTSDDAGCTELYEIDEDVALNIVENPSFEDDDDSNGVPDSWSVTGVASGMTYAEDVGAYFYGSDSVALDSTVGLLQTGLRLAANSFYTFSYYAVTSSGSQDSEATLSFTDKEGASVDFSGFSYDGDCAINGTATGYEMSEAVESSAWERKTCTFTTGSEPLIATIELSANTDVYFDSIQLELGETVSTFVTGYSQTPASTYYVVAPDYLSCDGSETEPSECDNYAGVCSAQEVGCELYTPADNDPSIPAITSSTDECPSECSGYETYKQEATDFDTEEFPLYFIADRANACSSQHAGCDSYTNLESVEAGGEEVEYYTDLRMCLTDEMADGQINTTSSTFFTWEGSDNAGYQLQTWQLLESDVSDSATLTFPYADSGAGYTETAAGLAPCSNWRVDSETEVVCIDTASGHTTTITEDSTCDEHLDIFTNPDCREFFDSEGNAHYRLWSETISVTSECAPYRKNESTETDCTESGGHWTDAGVCRYFAYAELSTECPASADGCRLYTGGSGRNATTVYTDEFEDGDVAEYDATLASISVSNESVASGGQSMRVTVSGSSGFAQTRHAFLNGSDNTDTFDETDETTCTDFGGTVSAGDCELDTDGDGTADCSIEDGDSNCGTLDDVVVAGKTFMLSFWAKGSGDIYVEFVEDGGVLGATSHDFVDPTDGEGDSDILALSGSWQQYELGPLDTESLTNVDDSTVVRWRSTSGEIFYIDNVQLKQVEENIAIIKDSWVVPAACDQTPEGTDSPQYYLGCEEYSDSQGDTSYFYQFSNICSEDAVGCGAFYKTQNTDSPYGEIYNARCLSHATDDITTEETVASSESCVVDGETYCTITTGRSYCLFDWEGSMPASLPTDSEYSIVLGPEAVVVENDMPVYIIADENTCLSSAKGCQEVGEPTYSQDQTTITGFTSAYYINLPDDYDSILCDNEELFCEEWSSTQDGNFYFKDPLDKTCAYESGVSLNGTEYYGWFREGTEEPCYWDDDGDGVFDITTDTAYLISGEKAGIWRNGDDDYNGWVGACSDQYDLCSEFIDPTDTAAGYYEGGESYYYVNNDLLSEDTLLDSQRCGGQVSQKQGCALFLNTTESEVSYNASASYIASAHADEFFSDAAYSLQDPIDCELSGGGEVTDTTGTTHDLCSRRCAYTVTSGDAIDSPLADQYTETVYYERSCYEDGDCPNLDTLGLETVSGTCGDVSSDYELENDTNTILKVNRDRECGAWLTCSSAQVSWSEEDARYTTICDEVSLCSEYSATGDSSFCTAYEETEAEVLSPAHYAARDVSWNGWEYSGYAIPDQLPIEHYNQININPSQWCESSITGLPATTNGVVDSCIDSDDCDGYWDTCEPADEDYRLVYTAGSCDEDDDGRGGQCQIGYCEDAGDPCSEDGDCGGTDECVIGWCQVISTTECTKDLDCSGASQGGTPTTACDTTQGVCVNSTSPINSCVTDAECPSSNATCTIASTTMTGSCFNDLCLTDIRDGEDADMQADALEVADARESECRGYPEATSPFPASKIVDMWRFYDEDSGAFATPAEDLVGLESEKDAQPYTLAYGFQSSEACAPIYDEDSDSWTETDGCDCSYQKAEYGEGASHRYYPVDYVDNEMLPGICVGGSRAGAECNYDSECVDDTGSSFAGSCMLRTRVDTVYGWQGYCLEQDTSIQLYGSSETEDQACLTWLPVDQLEGATDLYAKYTEAGYDDGETYYCAETTTMYQLQTGGEMEEFAFDSSTSGCSGDVDCPEGSFGIARRDDVDDDGFDECYYFCVPKYAYTEDGDECDLPEELTDVSAAVLFEGAGPNDAKYYRVSDDDYTNLQSYYASCSSVAMEYDETLLSFLNNDELEATSYRDGFPLFYWTELQSGSSLINVHMFAGCSTLVQTSDQNHDNYAWTDRVWVNAPEGYVIQDTGAYADEMTYEVSSYQSVFGHVSSIDYLNDISKPAEAVSCYESLAGMQYAVQKVYTLPEVNGSTGSCASGSLTSESGQDARSYRYFEGADGIVDVLPFMQDNAYLDPFFANCGSATDGDEACNYEISCGSEGYCDSGPLYGNDCSDDSDCHIFQCLTIDSNTSCKADMAMYYYETNEDVENRLKQIFAKVTAIYTYEVGSIDGTEDPSNMFRFSDDYGGYTLSESTDEWGFDYTRDGDGTESPSAPQIASVGDCDGSLCEEGDIGKFNINEQDSGEILGSNGRDHITARFFVWADADQMPIKNIIVDWGDGEEYESTSHSPADSYSGSTASTNFYKNHRGTDAGVEQCSSNIDAESVPGNAHEWGLYTSACSSSYRSYTKDYVCSESVYNNLEGRGCQYDDDGWPTNSPCIEGDACVFRPRVYVQDNWGWCTGECAAGLDTAEGGSNCYEDLSGDDGAINECDWQQCPGPDCAVSAADPWVYYDGQITVTK